MSNHLPIVWDPSLPDLTQSRLLTYLPSLYADDPYRRRGTAGALRDYLKIYMNVEPAIMEDTPEGNPFHFTVIFRVPDPSTIDQDRIQRIIAEEKPAHTTYTLRIDKG